MFVKHSSSAVKADLRVLLKQSFFKNDVIFDLNLDGKCFEAFNDFIDIWSTHFFIVITYYPYFKITK
jgi:hypothetical protein